jgi:hypothetical protein
MGVVVLFEYGICSLCKRFGSLKLSIKLVN